MAKDKFNLCQNDRVLDLRCGTGQIAIPIYRYVREVVALDPESEMLAEGKIQGEKSSASNIGWIEGRAEDLVDMKWALGKFQLVLVGTAFHWMNPEKALDDLYEMLNDGGGIIIANPDGDLFNKTEILQVVKKWLGEERRAGSGVYKPPTRPYEDVVSESKFHRMEFYKYPLVFTNDIDSIIGNIYSTSMANQNVLGDKKEAFERDLRDALLKDNPSGKFVSEGQVKAILAWK